MSKNVLADDKRFKYRGAWFASMSAVVGCIVFTLLDIAGAKGDSSHIAPAVIVIATIFIVIASSIFSLPFSIVGGYFLGWLIHKQGWDKTQYKKAVICGVVIAGLTLAVIFVTGGLLQICVGSHGLCEKDVFSYMAHAINNELENAFLTEYGRVFWARFFSALLIALIGGGISGWALSQNIDDNKLQENIPK